MLLKMIMCHIFDALESPEKSGKKNTRGICENKYGYVFDVLETEAYGQR
jgi:hypothetical protein